MMNNKTFEEQYQGKTYGALTILRKDPKDKSDHVLYCIAECRDCGNKKKMLVSNIIYGFSKSCGCRRVLNSSIARRKSAKILIDTPKGSFPIYDVAKYYGLTRMYIYNRYRKGLQNIEDILNDKRKPVARKPDPRLNGMTQKEATEYFGISKQLVFNRLKNGWTVDAENNWVSPVRGVVGHRVQKISSKAYRRMKKRQFLNRIYQ